MAIGWGVALAADPIPHLRGKSSPRLVEYRDWLLAKGTDEAGDAAPYSSGLKVLPLDVRAPFIENGKNSVLLLIPPARDWLRQGNEIDIFFEDGKGAPVVTALDYPHPQLPWAGWMDGRTGDPLNEAAQEFRSLYLTGNTDEAEMDRLAGSIRAVGSDTPVFGNADDVRRNMRPNIPNEVRWLAEFLGIFQEPETLLQCRPVRATWWS